MPRCRQGVDEKKSGKNYELFLPKYATIGKLITVARLQLDSGKELELYAYEILDYTGEITLRVHDRAEWVKLQDLLHHPQLPADLMISKVLVK